MRPGWLLKAPTRQDNVPRPEDKTMMKEMTRGNQKLDLLKWITVTDKRLSVKLKRDMRLAVEPSTVMDNCEIFEDNS